VAGFVVLIGILENLTVVPQSPALTTVLLSPYTPSPWSAVPYCSARCGSTVPTRWVSSIGCSVASPVCRLHVLGDD